MSEKKIKVKQVVRYGGHSLTANGSVNLTLKANYSELVQTIKLTQMLNNDVSIKAKSGNSKAMSLGSFRIKDIKIDGDGESVLKFNGLSDYVDTNNLNLLPLNDAEVNEFNILMEADVEIEEDGEDEDE